jgi:hypothetical protein
MSNYLEMTISHQTGGGRNRKNKVGVFRLCFSLPWALRLWIRAPASVTEACNLAAICNTLPIVRSAPVEQITYDRELKRWIVTAAAVIDPETSCTLHDHVLGPGASLKEIEERLRAVSELCTQVAGGEKAYDLGLFTTWVRAKELFDRLADARDALRTARLELLGAQSIETTGEAS